MPCACSAVQCSALYRMGCCMFLEGAFVFLVIHTPYNSRIFSNLQPQYDFSALQCRSQTISLSTFSSESYLVFYKDAQCCQKGFGRRGMSMVRRTRARVKQAKQGAKQGMGKRRGGEMEIKKLMHPYCTTFPNKNPTICFFSGLGKDVSKNSIVGYILTEMYVNVP